MRGDGVRGKYQEVLTATSLHSRSKHSSLRTVKMPTLNRLSLPDAPFDSPTHDHLSLSPISFPIRLDHPDGTSLHDISVDIDHDNRRALEHHRHALPRTPPFAPGRKALRCPGGRLPPRDRTPSRSDLPRARLFGEGNCGEERGDPGRRGRGCREAEGRGETNEGGPEEAGLAHFDHGVVADLRNTHSLFCFHLGGLVGI